MCSEETQKKILESDIFRILESEGVTEIGALYKVSPSKFVLVFESKTAKKKLEGREIQCRFGDSEICLNFHKRVGPLRNGREPILVTIFLPEFISDQAVRLAFSNFGDVVAVFKGSHKFNRKIRNCKKHIKIFPGEDPTILPRKSLSILGSKGMFSSRKRWCCATGAKLATCLARIALWLHPPRKILSCLQMSRVILLERMLLLCNQSLLLRLSLQWSLNRHLLLPGARLGRGILLWRRSPALILNRVQAQSLTMRVSLNWSLLLGQNFHRRVPLTCLLGGLRLIGSKILRSRGQFNPRREIKI